MAKEIERKFLVKDDSYLSDAVARKEIIQGYLCADPDATVRVRVSGEKAFLTVKGRNKGAVRDEWEYPVPVDDALAMLENCCGTRVLSKTRWILPARVEGAPDAVWEVDEFHGRHSGLTVAEIELPDEDTPFCTPNFIGTEVTGDPRYYNSSLVSDSLTTESEA